MDASLELILAHPAGSLRGGLATVHTDQNGQATVTFPEPFPVVPAAILTTPRNNLVATGTLVLTASEVTIWVWDLPANGWFTDRDVDLYWLGLF
jgi:hypothetical protein